jgi:predicted AAA+ superfamily ATPase
MTTVTQPNYLLLTEAVTTLRDALRPFVETQLRNSGPGWWKDSVLPNVSPLSRPKLPQQPAKGDRNLLAPLDVADLLQLITRNWATVFRGRLDASARSYASELYDTRTLWAHKGEGDVSRADLERAIDTAARLLDGINKKEAAAMRALRDRTSAAPTGSAPAALTPTAAAPRPNVPAAPPVQGVAGLRSWREIATPREDVRSGQLSQGQFAADLAEVARGNPSAGSEYLDPAEFFTRTYVTAGVRAFLKTALLRLSDQGGDAVVQLKTGFGGGKTHTMLALYHLAKAGPALVEHEALRDLFAETGGAPPPANVAVLVGTHIDATTPYDDEPDLRALGIQLKTLWGRMAWQLGRLDGYLMVQDADEAGVAPGAETLARLFTRFAPCVILIDELVAFARNLPTGRGRVAAGNFESTLTFIQALTEAAKAAPCTIVAASIPESDMEIGGMRGQETLRRIENTFGRVETPWTPVEATESFEVVRRRLFESVDPDGCDQAITAFGRLYRDNATDFPVETRERAYEERMRKAFPFHPELFERLYEDWNAAIPNFQSTRGVLRLLAGAVQWLWQNGDPSPAIMPGTLPLESPTVRDELMRYLDRGFQSVIEGDIDGAGAEATQIDAQNPRFAKPAAGRSVARTIFLGSVPGKATQGIEDTRIRLGAARPGEAIATYNDVLGRLMQRLQFLYGSGSGRYWFEVRPNLTKTASDRMSRCTDDDAFRLLEGCLKEDRAAGPFAGKHVAPADSGDVPDDTAVRLVVIAPRHPYQAGAEESAALRWAKRLLDTRGTSPRLNRTMLVFAAVDEESLPALVDEAKQFTAWESIVKDKAPLNLDATQVQQAIKNRDDASTKIETDLRIGYRWVLAPRRGVRQVDGPWTAESEDDWRATDTSQRGLGSLGGIAQRASDALQAEERLLTAWSPMFLARELERWFWPQGMTHVSVRKLWEENLTRYIYFPRLLNREVLAKAIIEGATGTDYFGYADGVGNDGRYTGLRFGRRPGGVLFDAESVLVRRDVALAQVEGEKARPETGDDGPKPPPDDGNGHPRPPRPPTLPKRFYGSVKLNPLRLGSSASQIGDEIVKHLTALVDAEVEVVLEVRACVEGGIPDGTARTVGENARTLKFQSFEFEEE